MSMKNFPRKIKNRKKQQRKTKKTNKLRLKLNGGSF